MATVVCEYNSHEPYEAEEVMVSMVKTITVRVVVPLLPDEEYTDQDIQEMANDAYCEAIERANDYSYPRDEYIELETISTDHIEIGPA